MSLIPRKRMSSDLLDPKPKKGSFNGVTSDGIFNATGEAIDNILDDGSASEAIVVAVPSSQSSDYVVGNYYEVQGKVAKLRTKTEGDNVTQLTFDTTSGLLDAMNDIVGDIASIGSPLQWKGPATVTQLNDGITGIQPGWTYTLTDAGTLTDGSIVVDVGDEVAWTSDGEWFKVGGENSKVALFQFTGTDYPDGDAILAEQQKGKTVVLVKYVSGYGGYTYDYYYLNFRVAGIIGQVSATYLEFFPADNSKKYIKAFKDLDAAEPAWVWTIEDVKVTLAEAVAPGYDPTSTYPTVGTAVMHSGKRYVSNTAINTAEDWTPAHWTQKSVEDEIGNVEALLAAL